MPGKMVRIPPSLCVKCRGAKMLCGLSYCPVSIVDRVKKVYTFRGNSISGSSPPSLFVGRYGYPKINIYPSTPPFSGNTGYLEDESKWLSQDLNDFISGRLSLLRGGIKVSVDAASNPDYRLQEIQVSSLSSNPVDVEMTVEKSFRDNIVLDENITPMGPSSPLKSIKFGNYHIDNRIEKLYYDKDLRASEGVISLYERGMGINGISKALSAGSLGTGKRRRIVPTRWSITATDKAISDRLVDEIKDYREIDSFEVYVRKTQGNLFVAILAPGQWMFEWGESWFPGSTWNSFGRSVEIELDYEGYHGRKTYPEIGGCYYSSRLAVAEKYRDMKRTGSAMLWREIYPGFNLPVGVWYVRENVRELFRSKPERFDTVNDAIKYVSRFTAVDIKAWKAKSNNLKYLVSNLDNY
ncbi:MAG: Nre family DNA repair protein [Ferroplasma sp.]|uniref:Nre family DNA repair protein n=1 Tax=Ferroplasma sp. TaxID=2591003 RepID=UPI002814D01F|nr:Nre family DNA repair protein [Ferroplasma sp.]WMT50806.1 MAG: Nre family DNA repair protein [Ferroplasma sp.]